METLTNRGGRAPLTDAAPAAIRIEPTRGWTRVLGARELWRYRELAGQLAARDVRIRYKQTALGGTWAILQPLLTMVVFSVFFGDLAGVPSDGLPYPLFSLAALVPWTFFANGLILGSNSLVQNSSLLSKVYFPRILIPLGTISANLVDFGIAFVMLIVVVVAFGFLPPLAVLAVPLLLSIALIAVLGVSVGLGALNVRYRDVRYVVPFLSQLWLFLTPVAYPSSLLDEPWRTLSAINPMAGVVEGFRWAVLGADFPGLMLLVSAASAVAMLGAGLWYFVRVERSFADVI